MKSILTVFAVAFVLAVPPWRTTARAGPQEGGLTSAGLDAEAAQARQRVIDIVNQPVTHLARAGRVGIFSPGWFHPGAIEPDFDTVDVRATQEFPYEGATYVSSDLNPSEMFVADELEFNAMTKYFYTDRSVPKKRLSEAEMLEINRLYRIIGQDEQALRLRWMWTALIGFVSVGGAGALLLLRQRFVRAAPSRGASNQAA